MREVLFRKKSLDKVNSPESLDKYLQVTTPDLWIFMAAIIILLFGALIWGIYGRVESRITTTLIANNNTVSITLSADQAPKVKEGMIIRIGEVSGVIKEVKASSSGYIAIGEAELSDGIYSGEIITESLSPLSLIFN